MIQRAVFFVWIWMLLNSVFVSSRLIGTQAVGGGACFPGLAQLVKFSLSTLERRSADLGRRPRRRGRTTGRWEESGLFRVIGRRRTGTAGLKYRALSGRERKKQRNNGEQLTAGGGENAKGTAPAYRGRRYRKRKQFSGAFSRRIEPSRERRFEAGRGNLQIS